MMCHFFFTCLLHKDEDFTALRVLREENTAYTPAGGMPAKYDYSGSYILKVKLKRQNRNDAIVLFLKRRAVC